MPTILITGTNKGLGLQFARKYAEDGWRVYAACRMPEKADDLNAIADGSNGQVSVHKLDVLDFGAIDALAGELDGVALDILMNNAGAKGKEPQGFGQVDYDEWDMVFRTNVMAVEKMIEAFVEHVACGPPRSVRTQPGPSATTLMPRPASSVPRHLVSMLSAVLDER